jgi:hypothetical protein
MKEIFFIILFLLSHQAISNEERWPFVINCQGSYDSRFGYGGLYLSCNDNYYAQLKLIRTKESRPELEASLSSLSNLLGIKISNIYNYNILFFCNSTNVIGSYSGLEVSSELMNNIGLKVGGFIKDDGHTYCFLGGSYENDNSLFSAGISTSLEIYK